MKATPIYVQKPVIGVTIELDTEEADHLKMAIDWALNHPDGPLTYRVPGFRAVLGTLYQELAVCLRT